MKEIINWEGLEEITLADMVRALQEGATSQIAMCERVNDTFGDLNTFVELTNNWAKITKSHYTDKTTADKLDLSAKFKEFLKLIIRRTRSQEEYTFANKKVKADAAYFGVRVALIKDLFELWLQRPELFKASEIGKQTSSALEEIIPMGEHQKYLACYDEVNSRWLNSMISMCDYTYLSGVKCMVSSVDSTDEGKFIWHPKQYMSVQWCSITEDCLNMLRPMLRVNPNDAQQYGKGVVYYTRNLIK